MRGVEGVGVYHSVKCRGIADCGDAVEEDLALLAQALERRHHLAEHDLRGQIAVPALPGDVVVQLEQIEPVELQPPQARLQRCGDRCRNAAALAGRNSHLGADPDIGSEALHDAPEIALGFTVPVHRRGVEIVDAELDGSGDRALLIGRVAAHHQPADRAAPEPEHGHLEPGPSERACFHLCLRCLGRGSKPSHLGLSIS